MKRALALFALAVLASLAYCVRVRAGAAHTLTGSEAADLGSHWLVDDARTAGHLRRIELAIAADRLPSLDRWLEHPQGAEVPWLPFFDLGLAAIAERVAGATAAPAPYVDEGDVEDIVLGIPPWLGALAVLLAAWSVRGYFDAKRGIVASLFAAFLCAVAPAAVRSGAAGQLDASVWLALLAALQIGLATRALRADEPLDAILGSLACGLVSGLALASSIAGCAVFIGAWTGFAVRAFCVKPEERALARRAGLCYCAVAAFVTQLPLSGEPARASGHWLISAWCSGSSQAVLFAAAPFLVAVLVRSRARALQAAVLVSLLGLLVYFAPETVAKLSDAAQSIDTWRWRTLDERGSSWNAVLVSLTPAAALFPPSAVFLGRGWRRPDHAMLLALAATSLALACVDLRALAVFIVPMACSLALLAAEGWEATSSRIRATARVLCAACAVVFSAAAVDAWRTPARHGSREESREWVSGLRWMRAHTPSAGAFNAASVPGDYAVLCTPRVAPLVVYHARRPTLASTDAIAVGESNLPELARTITGTDAERLARVMHAMGARYVVTGPRCLAEFEELEAGGGREGPREASLLWRLSIATDRDDPARIAGLTRVFASALRTGLGGRAQSTGGNSGPAISIWRLDAPPPSRAEAHSRPR